MPLPTPPALAHHAQSKCTLPALQVLEVLEFWLLHRYQAGVHHVLGEPLQGRLRLGVLKGVEQEDP